MQSLVDQAIAWKDSTMQSVSDTYNTIAQKAHDTTDATTQQLIATKDAVV